MKHFKILAAVALAAAAAAPPAIAAGPATVDVQVEGASAALVPTTTVTTTTAPVDKDGRNACTGTSAAGALERATSGDWSGTYSAAFESYSVERVKGETHTFDTGRYFSFAVNGIPAQVGICGAELQTGDDVLLYVACAGASTGCYAGEPLFATAPRTARPGEPFSVLVRESTTTYDSNYNATTTQTPSAGARVNGVTTGADGRASIALAERGAQLVTVTKGNRPPDRVPVCVTDGADGFCGTTVPAPGEPPAAPAPQPAPGQPRAVVTSVAERAAFARGRVPRTLKGTVSQPGAGVERIRLRLTRNDRGRCFAYDATRERQQRLRRCGAQHGTWFAIGDRAAWEYQLPFSLPRGRWVLDVQVRDRAGRVSRLERGNTRVVFTVR
jgi:hypothetical protein